MASFNVQEQTQKIIDTARKAGVAEHFFFLTAFSDFQTMRAVIQKLKEDIENKGSLLMNGKINPAIAQFEKTSITAIELSKKIISLIRDAEKGKVLTVIEKDEETEMPIFDELEKSEIIELCKKFQVEFKGRKRHEIIDELSKHYT